MTKSEKNLLFLLVCVVIISGIYWYYKNPNINSFYTSQSLTATTTQKSTSANPTPSTNIKQNTTSTGTVIKDAYSLFVQSKGDNNVTVEKVEYQEDGIVESGKYAGYHRIVSAVSFNEPGDPAIYTFATKDYTTFVVDVRSEGYINTQDYGIFNKTKVVAGVGDILLHYPPKTIISGNFVLTINGVVIGASLGNELASPITGFKFYSDATRDDYRIASTSPTSSYIAGNSDIYVQDSYGLVFDYTFMSKEQYTRQQIPDNTYDYNFYSKSEINSDASLYKTYGQLFPGGCGAMNTTYSLKNISTNDLVKVATTVQGVSLYTFKDLNHQLNKEAYEDKITIYKNQFTSINNKPLPSYEDYIAKHPVLVFQDSLGRWIGLGEWEYYTPGGCGKPVIYLYPSKPTEVTIQFPNPIRFTVDIPKYNKEWYVLANPDGELTDLQPELTDCTAINYNLKGSEYAQIACTKGIYPYLYWAGQTSEIYPTAKQGWIVNKNDVENFLDNKLTEIGLNTKEKKDMMEYWVPEILKKDTLYYRLSFFQTDTMDKFIPMQITPKPDTEIRVFLDWEPVTNMPTISLQPQILKHIDRKGFTMVEWGGLKQ